MAGPPQAATIDAMIAAVRAQTDEIAALVAPLAPAAFSARPAERKWSVGEHVAHLALANHAYAGALDKAVDDARARGLAGEAPYRTTWLGRLFVRNLEPPPRPAIRTFGSLVPPPNLDPRATLADFEAAQRAVAASLERSRGVDLGRARMRSPFMPLLRFAIVEGYQAVLAHNRRHLWHVRRALDALPAGLTTAR